MTEERSTPAALRHVVILCHPDPHSFNAAVADRYCEAVGTVGQAVVVRDLYRMGFDPVLGPSERPAAGDFTLAPDVAAELEILGEAQVIVFVYPIWFGLPPAMLKGYVDRVLGAGFSFRAIRDRSYHPALSGKRLMSFTSSGTSKPWLEEQGAWLALRTVFDNYLRHAFSLKGADHVHFESVVPDMSHRLAEEYLFQVQEAARRMCSIAGK